MERKEAEAHEQQMKGPGSFPLERLLAIFRCIVVESDSAPSNGFGSFHSGPLFNGNLEEAEGDGHMTEELSADVLMQLSTLVSVNLLSKSSTNPLDGNARYSLQRRWKPYSEGYFFLCVPFWAHFLLRPLR